MPVVGHAFVGLATGLAVEDHAQHARAGSQWKRGLWLPLAVTLAYLPDVVGKTLAFAGTGSPRALSHSLLFALAVSALLAPAVARAAATTLRRAAGLCLFSLSGHIALDLAQHTDRAPLWPFAEWHVATPLLPTGSRAELLLFGGGFLCLLVLRRLVGRPAQETLGTRSQASRWVSRCGVGLVLAAALATHTLRSSREMELKRARDLLLRRDYAGAFTAAAAAARWPSTASPGRLDYLRAEAYAELGDAVRAEEYYLKSYQAEPDYFWCVADLAQFYAKSARPETERRRLAAPYLQRLRLDFARHPRAQARLARIEAALGAPLSSPPTRVLHKKAEKAQ